MPKNEDGEFELVLGNKQLLSVFFIVAVLIAVFFTMGYIVGRNSSPLVASDTRKQEKPLVVDSPRPNPAGSPVQPGDTTSKKLNETRPADPTTETGGTAGPIGTGAGAPPSAAAKNSTEPVKNTPVDKPANSTAMAPVPDEPQAGETYLQVTAVARAEAEIFVDVLGKKGFHALFTPVPNDNSGLYRVLVGPFKDAGGIAQARTDLQKAGFKGFDALVRKY
jgi:cell division septation protein DedD